MIIIAGYIRVSTVKQKEKQISIKAQKSLIEKYVSEKSLTAKYKNCKLVFYVDDRYSGSSLKRPSMEKLIEDIKKDIIKELITYDFDRLSRDITDSQFIFTLIINHNVRMKCLCDDLLINTAGDRFGTNVKVAAKQFERERIVERTNDGLQYIADSGRYPCGGKILFGYRRGEDKNINIDEHNSKIIIKIFELAVQGSTLLDIAKIISVETKIKKFNSDVIKRILYDQRYIGQMDYKDKIYANLIPAIITEETQNQAIKNYKRNEKKIKNENAYLFRGKIYCSCGHRLKSVYGTSKQKRRYYYYKCNDCNGYISQNKILEYVNCLGLENASRKDQMDYYKNEIKKIKLRITRLKEKYILESINEKKYYAAYEPLNDYLQELTSKVNVLNEENFHTNPSQDKAEFYNAVRNEIKKIEVDPIKKVVVSIEIY